MGPTLHPQVIERESRPIASRSVRLGCWLVMGTEEIAATVVNLSEFGFQAITHPTAELPGLGSELNFRLLLPGAQDPIEGKVELAWTNLDDRDVGNRPV